MTADRSKSTDESLQNVRNALLKDIATTAAHAPGDNRLAQAKQIEGMIAAAKEFDTIVAGARKVNDTKFDEARKSFATSRAALAELSPSK